VDLAGFEPATSRVTVGNPSPSARLRAGGRTRGWRGNSALPLSYRPPFSIRRSLPRRPTVVKSWNARRDLNPRPPSPVNLPPSARGTGKGSAKVFARRSSGLSHGHPCILRPASESVVAGYSLFPIPYSLQLHPRRGGRRGSNPCLRTHNPTLWPLSYGHHAAAGPAMGRRERPARSRGVALFHPRRDGDAPPALRYRDTCPAFIIHPPPVLVVCRRKTAPPGLLRGRGGMCSLPVTARGSMRCLRARHGPPALVPAGTARLPESSRSLDDAGVDRTPSRIALADARRGGEHRPRIHRARRPHTGYGRFGRRSGVACVMDG
jgi:hypothetical protein